MKNLFLSAAILWITSSAFSQSTNFSQDFGVGYLHLMPVSKTDTGNQGLLEHDRLFLSAPSANVGPQLQWEISGSPTYSGFLWFTPQAVIVSTNLSVNGWISASTNLQFNIVWVTNAQFATIATNMPDGTPIGSYATNAANAGYATNAGAALTADFAKTCTGLSYTNIYRALLTQSGTADPTAVVLENTFGFGSGYTTLAWKRVGVGNYSVTYTNGFPQHKTFFWVGVNSPFGYGSSVCPSTLWVSTNVLYIYFAYGNGTGREDGDMVDAPFEILVYP